MHKIQEKILNLANQHNLANLTLRKMGELINEPDSPQKIKHHLNQLIKKGLLINIDNKIKKIKANLDKTTNLISLPIYGSANCGEALVLADNRIEEYLKLSKKILDSKLTKRIKDLFVLRARGQSMNKADINNKNIEDGDYVIIDKKVKVPKDGDRIVSIIDGAANIKKFFLDEKNKQIILISESTQSIPPIYIHQDDFVDYLVSGQVVDVVKKPEELVGMRNASASDILNDLGPIAKEEVEYYQNL